MKEEEKKQNETQTESMTADEYVENIKDVKSKMVSKEEYDKVVAEKKTLAKALADGVDIPENEKQEKPADIKEIRKKILNAGETNMSNSEYVQNVLDLRNALLAEGKRDPFLPTGIKRDPSNQDFAGAQRVADFFQNCLDESQDENGKIDEDIFNAQLKKGIANDSPVINAKLKKLGIL